MSFNLTFIGQMIAFGIFIFLTMKFIWPPLIAAMEERTKQIADGLAAADRASKDLELAQDKAGEQLREAKGQAADIIEAANKRAAQLVDEAKDQAKEEAARIATAAQADIEQEFNRTKEELRSQVAVLAIAGAEKILNTAVDQNVHSEMLGKLAAEL